MKTTNRPPVERVRPPKPPCRVVNRVMGRLLSTPGRSRRLSSRRPAAAELMEDLHTVAKLSRSLIETAGRAEAGTRTGIRINVSRTPTLAELADAARRDGPALVYLDVARMSQ